MLIAFMLYWYIASFWSCQINGTIVQPFKSKLKWLLFLLSFTTDMYLNWVSSQPLKSSWKFSAQHVWRYQKKSEIILWNVPPEKNWSYEHILSKILNFYGSLYYKINLLGGFLYFQNMTLTVHPCMNYNLRLNLFFVHLMRSLFIEQ